MEYLAVFIIGLVVGVVILLIINWLRRREAKTIAQELISQTESQRVQDLEALINRIKESFGALSLEALSKNTNEFLKLANETLSKQTQLGEKELEGKKKLIDQTLEAMKGDLQKVQELMTTLEGDRAQKFGELANQLKATAEQTGKLQETTSQLRVALASTKARGHWGERMAEDVLRLAGFVEGINYLKQKVLETVGKRPDYTFLLPQNLKVNMDVKFPLDNYLHYLEADGESDKEMYKDKFLKDARTRIKEVITKDYINPEENTVDYVIVFIPNEQIYAFIHENDSSVLDEALKNKVILCSPITLYAILAVIRQAVDNFNLERTSAQILSLLGAFNKQWSNFLISLEKMGKKIDEAKIEFNTLTSTRRTQLERPLSKIEDLRKQKGIPEASLVEGETIALESPKEVNDE
ncbi:MAG: DNA recombination protein RmuC [candidate division WOR-3 bacterium]|nr:DNA recombination protein RmuC [candidate division WOR-3 bacterium]